MPVGDEQRVVALVCPTAWDRVHLPDLRSRWPRYDVRGLGPDAEHAPERFDAQQFIAWAVQLLNADPADGVARPRVTTPAASSLPWFAEELGLPGPSPNSVLRCSHKYYARLAQREVAPEATPRFQLIDPMTIEDRPLELPFPVFVKPVKSWFSQHARQIDSLEELHAAQQ